MISVVSLLHSGLRHAGITLVLAVGFTAFPPVYGADNALNLAIVDYAKGDYLAAIGKLEALCQREPFNGAAHYCLGNCYLKLSESAAAVEEYKKAVNYLPDAKTAHVCRKAISMLVKQPISTAATPTRLPGSDTQIHPSLSTDARNFSDSVTHIPLPSSFNHNMNDEALKRIEDQANSAYRNIESQKVAATSIAKTHAESEASRLRAEGELEEKRMQESFITRTIKGKVWKFPEYTAEQIAEKKAWYEDKAKCAEESGLRRTEKAKSYFTLKQNGLSLSAEGLSSQLKKTPRLSDSTALEPLGTNLFVRNYQPISRILDNLPRAKPLTAENQNSDPSIGKAEILPPFDGGQMLPASKLAPSASTQLVVKTQVKGKLLK